MKRELVVLVLLLFILPFTSANVFSDFYNRITGKVTATCGNGQIEAGEICDGDAGSFTCSDFGFAGGVLKCSSLCKIDTSECTTTENPPEEETPSNDGVYCFDSDGGKNYSVQGNLTYGNSTFTDQCGSATQLFEYFCPASSNVIADYYNCPGGCLDGICLPEPTENPEITETEEDETSIGTGDDGVEDDTSVASEEENTEDEEDNNLLDTLILEPLSTVVDLVQEIFTDEEKLALSIKDDPFSAEIGDLKIVSEYYNDLLISTPTVESSLERKKVMLALLEKDTEEFLEKVIASEEWGELPEEVQENVEIPIDSEGIFSMVTANDDIHGNMEEIYFFETNSGEEKQLFFTEKPEYLSGSTISLSGFQLEDSIATDTSTTILIEDPISIGASSSSPNKINRNVLTIFVKYLDSPGDDYFQKEDVDNLFIPGGLIDEYFRKSSGEKFTFTSKAVGWYYRNIPSSAGGDTRKTCIWSPYREKGQKESELSALLNLASQEVNVGDYDTVLVIPRVKGLCGGLWAGWAGVGTKYNGKFLAVSRSGTPGSNWDDVIVHELGHTLGLGHAGSMACNNEDCIVDNEYGNAFDTMGSGYRENDYFNSNFRTYLGFHTGSSPLVIREAGIYTLPPLESFGETQYANVIPKPPSFYKGKNNKNFYFLIENREKEAHPTPYRTLVVMRSHLLDPKKPKRLLSNWLVSDDPYLNLLFSGDPWTDKTPFISTQGITIGPIWSINNNAITFEVRYHGDGPYVELRPPQQKIYVDDKIKISWEASADAECVASSTHNTWSGNKEVVGEEEITITKPETYTLSCKTPEDASTTKSISLDFCGNGNVDFGENCDDGNLDDGDGCSVSCYVEDDWVCIRQPSECSPLYGAVCGDGFAELQEQCDDGNTVNNDGCSSSCQIEEPGIGEPEDTTAPTVSIEYTKKLLRFNSVVNCFDSGSGCDENNYFYKVLGKANNAAEFEQIATQCQNTARYQKGSAFTTLRKGLVACAYAKDAAGNTGFAVATQIGSLEAECGDEEVDSGEQCDSGVGCSSACSCNTGYEPTSPGSVDCKALPPPPPVCDLTSATWSTTGIVENTQAILTVQGTNCGGKVLSFVVKERDVGGDDDATTNPSNAAFSGNTATTTWITEFQDDGFGQGGPEYYFTATVVGENKNIQSQTINVIKKETASSPGGTGSTGGTPATKKT